MADANRLPPHQKALSAAARGEVDDVLHDVAKEELRPVVREAITEDVLRAAADLVALTPTMVAAITEDLNGSDKLLRQKAYTLLAKYTLGNTSIAPQQEHSDQPLQVVFNLPRPGDNPSPALDLDVDGTVELRQCMECAEDKPTSEFVGMSERCQVCHDALRAKVMAEFS